jgi:hypothetical protein
MHTRKLARLLIAVGAVTLGCNRDAPTEPESVSGDPAFTIGRTTPNRTLGGDMTLEAHSGDPTSVPVAIRVGLIDPLQDDRAAGTWHRVRFDPPFHPDAQVVVIPMTQTYNGSEPPGLRIRRVTPNGFEIRFDEIRFTSVTPGFMGLISSDLDHGDETVGWVAYAFKVGTPKDGDGLPF